MDEEERHAAGSLCDEQNRSKKKKKKKAMRINGTTWQQELSLSRRRVKTVNSKGSVVTSTLCAMRFPSKQKGPCVPSSPSVSRMGIPTTVPDRWNPGSSLPLMLQMAW